MFRFTNLIIFELTRSCNLNCKYCYQQVKPSHEIIPIELFCKIIDQICAQRVINNLQDERLQLNFHGGECTLVGKENFKAYVEYAIKTFSNNGCNFQLGVQTNGTLLDDEWLDIFKFYDISLGVSFDGISEKDPLRYSEKQQKNIYQMILSAKKKGIQVGSLAVINKHNIETIQKDKQSLSEQGLTAKLNYLEDIDYPENSDLELSGDEIYSLFLKKEIDSFLECGKLPEYHSREILTSALIDILTFHDLSYDTGCDGRFCGAGISMIAVRPDGSMGYCDRYSQDFSENYIQNALDYDFLGFKQLNAAIKFDVIKSRLLRQTGCDTCRASFVCNTGCMAFYFSKFGEYGIQKSLVCDQFLQIYDYIYDNLLKILNKLAENNIILEPKALIYDCNPYWSDQLNQWNLQIEILNQKQFQITRKD